MSKRKYQRAAQSQLLITSGPTGAGKSSLMKILVALMKPSSGVVMIDGKDIQKQRKKLKNLSANTPTPLGLTCLPKS